MRETNSFELTLDKQRNDIYRYLRIGLQPFTLRLT